MPPQTLDLGSIPLCTHTPTIVTPTHPERKTKINPVRRNHPQHSRSMQRPTWFATDCPSFKYTTKMSCALASCLVRVHHSSNGIDGLVCEETEPLQRRCRKRRCGLQTRADRARAHRRGQGGLRARRARWEDRCACVLGGLMAPNRRLPPVNPVGSMRETRPFLRRARTAGHNP